MLFHILAPILEKRFLKNLFRIVWCNKTCYWMKIWCNNGFIVLEQVNRGEMLGGVRLLDTSCIAAETVLK